MTFVQCKLNHFDRVLNNEYMNKLVWSEEYRDDKNDANSKNQVGFIRR